MIVDDDALEVREKVAEILAELKAAMLSAPVRELKYWKTTSDDIEAAADRCAIKDATIRLVDLAYKRVLRERLASGQPSWACEDCG